MTQNSDKTSMLYSLPTEVLLYIFTYLPAKQLVKSREVCLRWRNIIDGVTRSDSLWRKHCRQDFNDVYKIARSKARVGMLWFNIYRSLSLWPKLEQARVIRDEFASATCVNDEIQGFEVLKDGIIGIHKRGAIIYYDIETLEPSKRGPITGDYMHYTENKDTIIIRSYHLHLFIVRKIIENPHYETNATFDNVKICLLFDRELYYVDLNNDIYVCKLIDGNLSARFLKHSDESVLCLGYSNHLNILTFQRNIYSIINGDMVLSCNLDESSNLIHELYKYKLVETVDWGIFFQWMCLLRRRVPEGPLQEILTVRMYGDIVLVGCNWGVFRIYYKPFSDGEFDLYNAEPVKQYNFMERSDCPVLTMCPILKVDVLEAEDGHTIIVAMPKKIAILDFIHSFKRTASVAMLPYADIQRVKLFRVEDHTVNSI
ncbi:hypothetical protein O0L34_g15834 [Tuta absoluta]|nr:hypothetical protein O0L34_g10582 [Tuta absoluta]KAJ2942289.1 hypothetical protein O0L34_g15834 [Tuta absoluta]